MQNVFTDYPPVPWKPGWRFSGSPGDACALVTGDTVGEITVPGSTWSLQLLDSSIPLWVRVLNNGLSLCVRRREALRNIQILFTEPGVLTGTVQDLPLPVLHAPDIDQTEPGISWIKDEPCNVLFACRNSRFVLVTGSMPVELARLKAEDALEEDFDALRSEETRKRLATAALFSINPRHNPPVALAAESLRLRLRERTAALPGVWSAADGSGPEKFLLNELYPLVQAWCLIEPETALALAQTALSLQQNTGGFPAWADNQGAVSSAAAWPFIIQSFELALQHQPNPAALRKARPALRKYMQWALRRFDPYRDQIPAWQSEQEVFIPDSFERGKATPDLTVMLIAEVEALQRLCSELDSSETAGETLKSEHEQLTHTLKTVFWNPETKAFSNVWKDGHTLHEPSFASFMPLLWPGLPSAFKTALLETFEESHGFPGQAEAASWKKEQIDDTAHLPVIHQFMALQALRLSDSSESLVMLFVRRTREGFSAWFERESIEAVRLQNHTRHVEQPAYHLGPVTASFLLTAQAEFQHEAGKQAPARKSVQRFIHRLTLTRTDFKILMITALTMLVVHLLYRPIARSHQDSRMAEAALSYQQGQFSEAMQICRRYPDNPLSLFLQGNMMMLTESPELAEPLYYDALIEQIESPSPLFGYALSLQMNEKFDEAIKRYNDFLDIYELEFEQTANVVLIQAAYAFIRLAEEEFRAPPKWRAVYSLPIMQDLGL